MARFDECPDCGWANYELECVRCGGRIRYHGTPDSAYCVKRGCKPSSDAPATVESPVSECGYCGKDACSRAMVATEHGVFCSWVCAGKDAAWALRERYEAEGISLVCPMCDDGVSSPAFGDTCSVRCQTEAETRAGGVTVCTCPAQYDGGILCICKTTIPEAPKADSGDSAVARFGGAA